MKFFNFFKKKVSKHETLFELRYIKKVLIVDDASSNRYVIKKYIEKTNRGIIIDEAVNGQEAIDKVVISDYDIIFLDIKMPVMNGLLASKEIIKIRPDMIIYGVTGQIEKDSVKLAMAAGMKKCIAKPVYMKDIQEIILKPLNIAVSN
jgi:CheY-like chemotaxis protein